MATEETEATVLPHSTAGDDPTTLAVGVADGPTTVQDDVTTTLLSTVTDTVTTLLPVTDDQSGGIKLEYILIPGLLVGIPFLILAICMLKSACKKRHVELEDPKLAYRKKIMNRKYQKSQFSADSSRRGSPASIPNTVSPVTARDVDISDDRKTSSVNHR